MDPVTTSTGPLTLEKLAAAAAAINATTGFSITLAPGQLEDLQAIADGLGADFMALVRALTSAAAILNESWERLAETLGTTSTKMAEFAATVVEDQIHGRAAVCPRHGPTRGGMCMRCAR